MDNKITKVIGTVTAYGDAVKAGYQGSREDWIRLQMQSGVNAQRAETAANAADASAQRAAVSEANAADSAQRAENAAGDAAASQAEAGNHAADAQTSADRAAASATGAAGSENAAKTSADAAAQSAAEAAETLESIPADYTELVQEVGKLSEEIDKLKDATLNTDTWAGIQKIVQAGLGPKLLPVGTQLAVNHSVYGTRLFDVVAHDYLKSVHDESAHTMTIQQHDLLPGTQFDAPEAFYYAEAELPAGTYNFTLATAYNSWAEGTYQFTLTKSVPKGGQLAISGYADAAMTARQVRSYANQTTTSATESVAITAGSGGTNLGTFGEGLNHSNRVSYGSNNYKESAMRQFLNSSAAAGSVWTPQTKFDRPPSWLTSLAGYKNGLDQNFLAVVGKVVLPCSANNTYEAPDSSIAKGTKYTLNDEFYLASAREIFNTNWDVADDSKVFPFYEGAGDADRIKYRDGSAETWWLRTPTSGNANAVCLVRSDGTVSNVSVIGFHGLAPACTIV